jgi:hypothetical protein
VRIDLPIRDLDEQGAGADTDTNTSGGAHKATAPEAAE